LLLARFPQAFAEQDLLVFHSDRLTVQDAPYQVVVQRATQALAGQPHVAAVVGPLDPTARAQVSADGHAALALVGLTGSDSARQTAAPALVRAAQAAGTPDVQVYLAGQSPLLADVTAQGNADIEAAEELGLPVAALVLLLAFGTLVAAGLPLVLAGAGLVVAFGTLGLAGQFVQFDITVQEIAMMLGLGVGIDYSLFLVTRFREELAAGAGIGPALGVTLATSGKTVFFSGLTVLISLAGLLLINSPVFAAIAIGSMITIAVLGLAALTLLPAVLALLGGRLNRLALPFLRQAVLHPDPDRGFWARWARGIMRHPALWAGLTTLVLLALAAPALTMRLGLDMGTGALAGRPAGQALAILQRDFSPGALSPIQLVVAAPHRALTSADLDAVARLTAALEADPEVAGVDSITTALDQAAGSHGPAALAQLAARPDLAPALGYVVNLSAGSDTTLLAVIPCVAPDSPAAAQLVRRIRDRLVPQAAAPADLAIHVGGLTAQTTDIADETTRKTPWVIAAVLALSFGLLSLVFRSLVLALKAIVMNLLSLGAAFGLLVWVFQQGAGARLFGFTSSGTIQVYLPLFTFAIVFGLSMDYEVFLIGRMKEEWERSGSNAVAVTHGLQHTARIITSAAAIMVAVFIAFTFTKVLEGQQIGFALAVAILLDATLVRVLLVPATMRLLGHWNWWFPPLLDRVLPHIELGEGYAEAPVAP
jgi:RND superfamily putative drug exporter